MTDSIAISIDRPANDILINNKEQALPIDEQEYTSPNPSTNASSINSEGSPGMNDSIPNNNSSNTSQSNYSSASLASSPSSTSSSNRQQQPAAVTYKYRTNPTAHITNLLSLDHSHLKPGQNASLLSYAQTINMYRENAKKTNNPDIQCELAKFIIDAATRKAEGEAQDEYLAEAEKLLKQLSIKGHADAQYELGKLFAAGLLHKKGRKPELEKAFALFVQASKHFHADAANRAGQCYEKGLGCRVNGSKAIQFYKKSASLGHPGAMYKLGVATMNGDMGLPKNPKDAVKWHNRSVEAATPDYPEAIHELANLHVNGIPNVIFVDLSYAVSLYNEAADMNYAPSAFKLGECYEYGKLNCQPDPALSIHYYAIAAEKGDRDACFALTAWYLVGSPNALPQSDENAYLWAKRAADMSLPKAEYAVGYFTETGIGCEKNPAEALKWYQKAANNGDKRAMQRLQQRSKAQEQLPKDGKKKRSASDDCTIM